MIASRRGSRIRNFYEIILPKDKINNIVNLSKGKGTVKENIKQAEFLPFGLASNFRKGKIGYWKNEMNEQQIKKCKKYFGAILMELNYEKNLNW